VDQKRLGEEYAAKALDMLRKAAAVHYFDKPANKEKLEKSPDLKGVRGQSGFGELAGPLIQ
jgi:hypothetical protein